MAFDAKALSVVAYANGFTLWHYESSDALKDQKAPDYFATASDTIRGGDLIICVSRDSVENRRNVEVIVAHSVSNKGVESVSLFA